jgi:AAA family ATP:ADP antiporter
VVVLAFVVPLYAKLVASRPQMRLINTVTAFFTACLVLFYFLAQVGVSLAIPFFIWIGIFSLMIVAQFWSFANVIYGKSEGERLFAIVGFGASLGAVVARVRPIGSSSPSDQHTCCCGAAVLGSQVLLTNYVDGREEERRPRRAAGAGKAREGRRARRPSRWSSARGTAADGLMLMLTNWVRRVSSILGNIVKHHASDDAAGESGRPHGGQIIGDFYSKYFTYVNVLSLVPQPSSCRAS